MTGAYYATPLFVAAVATNFVDSHRHDAEKWNRANPDNRIEFNETVEEYLSNPGVWFCVILTFAFMVGLGTVSGAGAGVGGEALFKAYLSTTTSTAQPQQPQPPQTWVRNLPNHGSGYFKRVPPPALNLRTLLDMGQGKRDHRLQKVGNDDNFFAIFIDNPRFGSRFLLPNLG